MLIIDSLKFYLAQLEQEFARATIARTIWGRLTIEVEQFEATARQLQQDVLVCTTHHRYMHSHSNIA